MIDPGDMRLIESVRIGIRETLIRTMTELKSLDN
jgi:hypothetical protein